MTVSVDLKKKEQKKTDTLCSKPTVGACRKREHSTDSVKTADVCRFFLLTESNIELTFK